MSVTIMTGDCREVLKTLPDASVQCCVTSPPYWGLRDYGNAAQIGKESTPAAFVAEMVAVFAEVRRVLKDDGSLWLNLGDSYASRGAARMTGRNDSGPRKNSPKGGNIRGGIRREITLDAEIPAKNLIGIPWRVAFALQDDGWVLREDIIWAKPNCMPESVTDRCTRSHEYLFHLTKSANYYHNADAIKEPAIYSGIAGMDETGFKDAEGFDGKHKIRRAAGLTGGAYSPPGQPPPGQPPHGNAREAKQRGHSRRHDGFNGRWDAMEKEEQCSGMRNKRSVWTVAPANYPEAHFATYPPDLIRPCILAGCPVGGTVLDPFGGSGTTGEVAEEEGRNSILIELNPEYAKLAEKRTEQRGLFAS